MYLITILLFQIIAVVFLVCYAMVESKPRYPYADRYPAVNDDIHKSEQALLQQICHYMCEMANKQTGEKRVCGNDCGYYNYGK